MSTPTDSQLDQSVYSNYPNYKEDLKLIETFLKEFAEGTYFHVLQEVANRTCTLVEIRCDDINEFDPLLCSKVITDVRRYTLLFQTAVDNLLPPPTTPLREIDVQDVLEEHRRQLIMSSMEDNSNTNTIPSEQSLPPQLTRRYQLNIIACESSPKLFMRSLKSQYIGQLVKVCGVVTRITDVRPLVTVATYTCDECGHELYQIVDGKQYLPLNQCQSSRCKQNKKKGTLHMQTRGSKFVKFQEMHLQELPEQVPVGHVPRSIVVHLRMELTRQCTAGQYVEVDGMYLPTPYTGWNALRAGLTADSYLHATKLTLMKQTYEEMEENDEYEQMMNELNTLSFDERLNKVAGSIAPEIFGMEDVKIALLLLLIGGTTKQKETLRIRGDINVLLMGDPGVAKSQLLKYIAKIAPRAAYTTGKGSSGVGLTAAVVRDTISKELILEGGALVLADGGVCCIDEFDKMEEADRTAIHEVMEQQTVSIAKAGITTTLNARTSILAAANPLYGRYNMNISPEQNLNLPQALLSRFDFVFLLRDLPELEHDRKLADHILYVHQHLKRPPIQGQPLSLKQLRYFVAKCRRFLPEIPKALSPYLVEAYLQMRRKGADEQLKDDLPCTPRSLLSLIRSAQALARFRFSNTLSHQDIEEAIRLQDQSKKSIREDTKGKGGKRLGLNDYQTAIWELLRTTALHQNTNVLNKKKLVEQVRRNGYTVDQLKETLIAYEQLNILHIGRTSVTII